MTVDAKPDLSQPTKLVLQGDPPSSLERFFPSKKETVKFYSSVRAQQYDVAQVRENCSSCEQAPTQVVAEFEWHALFGRLSLLHLLTMLLGHLTFGETDIAPTVRQRGRVGFWGCLVVIVALVALDIRRRRRNCAAYYRQAAEFADARGGAQRR